MAALEPWRVNIIIKIDNFISYHVCFITRSSIQLRQQKALKLSS